MLSMSGSKSSNPNWDEYYLLALLVASNKLKKREILTGVHQFRNISS